MYAQLGDIVFEGLLGLTGLRQRKASSLAQHAVIDGKPKLQKTGNMLDEVDIEVTFHSRFCNPESEINKLEQAVEDGTIMPLITGTGETIGNFVASETTKVLMHTDKNGAIIHAKMGVRLIESADDDLLGAAISAAKSVAFSNAANSPNTVPFLNTISSQGLVAVNSLSSAKALQQSGTGNLTLANASTDLRPNELRKAKKAFEGVNSAVVSFEDAFSKVESAVSNVDQIKAAATTAKTYAQNVISAIESGDVEGAIAANRDLRNGLLDLDGKSSELVSLTAIRRI